MIVHFTKRPDFEKGQLKWYLQDKMWRGDNDELLLPISFAGLIEEHSSISAKDISFHISKHPIEDADVLNKIHNEDMEDGRYESIVGEVYICELLLLYFPEGYPNKIYYKYANDTQ